MSWWYINGSNQATVSAAKHLFKLVHIHIQPHTFNDTFQIYQHQLVVPQRFLNEAVIFYSKNVQITEVKPTASKNGR